VITNAAAVGEGVEEKVVGLQYLLSEVAKWAWNEKHRMDKEIPKHEFIDWLFFRDTYYEWPLAFQDLVSGSYSTTSNGSFNTRDKKKMGI